MHKKYYILKNPSQSQIDASLTPLTTVGEYSILSNDNNNTVFDTEKEYNEEFTRVFKYTMLEPETLVLAMKYAYYYPIDDNRLKSGQWQSGVITAKVLRKRDIGDFTDLERLEFETLFADALNWLKNGHWKACLGISNQILDNITNQKYIDFANDLLKDVQSYINEYY